MYPSFDDFRSGKEKIAVVGLGYVGLPLGVLLGSIYRVTGFDIDCQRVCNLRDGRDKTGEVLPEVLKRSEVSFTSDPRELKGCRIIIVTVPTPIDSHKLPDLTPLKKASETVGGNLSVGTVVVYESTVYPGVTEDVCVPILEEKSGLRCGADFRVGYSPERINPGDSEHTLIGIKKVVSAQDKDAAMLLSEIYGSVIEAGVHIAPDIRTAEAAKVIENIQRDLNIALMNELALIFNKLGIDTWDVLKAAGTKWNFHKFEPGLVGGHCIGVDPYYLTFKAEETGHHPTVILAGRRINDQMGKYIAEQTVKRLIGACKPVKGSKVIILGITFKENVRDIRNTKIVDVYNELREYGIRPYIYDPLACPEEVKDEYGINLVESLEGHGPYDAIIYAVRHKVFSRFDLGNLKSFVSEKPVLVDIKAVYTRNQAEDAGFIYWRL